MFLNWATITALLGLIGWIIAIIMLFIVPVNRKPSSATAWLLLIFIFPYLGLVIFLLLGSPKLPKRRRAEQHNMSELISKLLAEASLQPGIADILDPEIPPRYEPFVKLNASLGKLPAMAVNAVELIPEYNAVFARIAADIDTAQQFVHFEYFATSRDEETEAIFAVLERAASRGVKVCMLMDHLGSREYPNFKEMQERLTAAGIEHHISLPLHFFGANYTRIDLRNHRKIVVIDGQIGYTGSQNLIKRNYFRKDAIYYDELVARIRGPVVVELEAVFATDWYSESGILLTRQNAPEVAIEPRAAGSVLCQILPSGSGFEDENNLKLFTALIHAARKTLVITNPYFIPDDALMTALTSAAQRGVEVTLVNSEASDQFLVSHAERSYYEDLLKAGVKLYRYKEPILLHSKHITVDDDIAVIGSSNMDIRSFLLNLEVTLICYAPSVVADLRQVEARNMSRCNADHPLEVYRFLRGEVGTHFMQFIPRVERINEQGEIGFQEGNQVTERSVKPEQWGTFLITIFDEWVRHDVGTVFVQMFDAALASWYGAPPALCIFAETCGNALALEHNGDLYSCDHFVEPKYLLGNIKQKHMIELIASDQQRQFGLNKRDSLPRYCRECAVRFACHGECPKNRFIETPDGEPGLNYLSAGYKAFFLHVNKPMRIIAELLRRNRAPAEVMLVLAAEEAQLQKAFAKAGRNEPCPCGSGRKFKQCHGR